jgi:hypothetical protein
MPVADPIPNEDHGYRLVLDEQRVDVFRFRAKHDAALRVPGAAGVRLMREALAECGHDSAGLYGDCALRGLSGRWADETRFLLGGEHERAVVWCRQQELKDDGHYPVLSECERRSVNQERPTPGGHRPRAALLDGGSWNSGCAPPSDATSPRELTRSVSCRSRRPDGLTRKRRPSCDGWWIEFALKRIPEAPLSRLSPRQLARARRYPRHPQKSPRLGS